MATILLKYSVHMKTFRQVAINITLGLPAKLSAVLRVLGRFASWSVHRCDRLLCQCGSRDGALSFAIFVMLDSWYSRSGAGSAPSTRAELVGCKTVAKKREQIKIVKNRNEAKVF